MLGRSYCGRNFSLLRQQPGRRQHCLSLRNQRWEIQRCKENRTQFFVVKGMELSNCWMRNKYSFPLHSLSLVCGEAEAAAQVPAEQAGGSCCFWEGRQSTRQVCPLSSSIFWFQGQVTSFNVLHSNYYGKTQHQQSSETAHLKIRSEAGNPQFQKKRLQKNGGKSILPRTLVLLHLETVGGEETRKKEGKEKVACPSWYLQHRGPLQHLLLHQGVLGQLLTQLLVQRL
ncbi:hypothetical protein EK904_005998 [Melospiza melodia maxima]|nr:hypothetical protein EK904_005998 [Melospiza melodia maxima]